MPIEFKTMVQRIAGHAGSDRLQPSNNPSGWSIQPKKSVSHSLRTTLRATREGDSAERGAHLDRKDAFRAEIQASIFASYGSHLGQKLWKSAGLDGKHWPTVEQIRNVGNQAAAIAGPEGLKLLGYIHADTGGGLRDDLPEMNFLTAEQRQRFNAELIDQVAQHAAFKDGTLPTEAVTRMARDLLARKYPSLDQLKQARVGEACETLSQTLSVRSGSQRNFHLLGNQPLPPPIAQQAIDRAQAYFTANPDALEKDGDVLRDVTLRAEVELKPLLIEAEVRKLAQPAAHHALVQGLASRYTPAQVDAMLAAVENDLRADPAITAKKLAGKGTVAEGMWRRVSADVVGEMRTPGPMRQALRQQLGNPPDDARLDAALARAEESMRKAPKARFLADLAANPVPYVARQMKLDLLQMQGEVALRNPTTVERLVARTGRMVDNLSSKASLAIARLSNTPAQLDQLDYAALKDDPAGILYRMAADLPG